ncbi:T9SS type B sorting domain-containing protein [Flavobacterium sp. SUN052]|uniref:Ig-like domain-containing protein n=1 Tax=Flavobacterium sp. SUN052 TaxID=3002441 RepID=UPI00237E1E02|nr:T9SS type B sorting domain-containing protein [Flavobacterium sp. SUN052]MEC4003155.1 T9SS type B sorting domain-containing protein [Flavobacterium sp. SUN052]
MKFYSIIIFSFISMVAFANRKNELCKENSLLQQKDTIVKKNVLSNVAPILNATGNQTYCIGSPMKIVTNMDFTDPDDLGVAAIYIQISSGYVFGEDTLSLSGFHPTITSSWNAITGKLTLTGVATQPTYIELKAAIEDVDYNNSSANPSGSRTFSISIGDANYLPSNGHYYQYVPNIGITWSDAKIAAQSNNYYGIQGYLATITAADEAQLSGEQSAGAGWIGGSDEQVEGVWRWMTGPETGLNFWNGDFQGSSPNFAFWNTGEPNSVGNEDYAHVTAPGVGIPGSWNDLSNTGDTSGNYQPKGYIVEYGGMPGDPIIQISTSSIINIPTITSSYTAPSCGSGSLILHAVSTTGTVNWYSNATGGTVLATGNDFTTSILNTTTTFYAAAHSSNCPDDLRVPIIANVTPTPILTYTSPYFMCDESYTVIDVQTTSGILLWYDSPTAVNPIFLGTHFVVPNIHQDTVFYAEANFNGCLSNRVPVTIKVYAAPIANDETIEICAGTTITLNAGNPGLSYLWSTGEISQTINSTIGVTNYSVIITTPSPELCSKTKNFNIVEHTSPTIDSIVINGNSATIITATIGDFEYSIDGSTYQISNEFLITDGGLYNAYVREKHGCGLAFKPFIIITIPQFFTPNGDGINDNWSIKGLVNYPNASVKIVDRFGKLVVKLDATNYSWDGTLNGKMLLSDDYWYVFKIDESLPELKGHFSLKR